ncbi:hypothetical protein [Cellulophaga sp. Hel_I_12]|uniref:hypothetical protein n=1 Tax=Cellulophaga sp. Hel_I_12 TaxID=1249972 RepID=UPI000648E33D|nr:hypothetical protein [Cellulophaga sp. Hel_I_12]|tara:strand:+ start:3349 stop:3552 length:204 start_codon:yes stop_codon:yes gene_type:complete
MKSLKNLNFGGNEVLQRSQMKSIFGGTIISEDDGGPGNDACHKGIECESNYDCNAYCSRCSSGTCIT